MLTKKDIQNNVAIMTNHLFLFANIDCPKCHRDELFILNGVYGCEKCGYYLIIK